MLRNELKLEGRIKMSNTKNERKTMIVEQYVADHVSPEDEPHVRIIARMAQHTIFEKFRAMLDENIVLAVFGCTIDAIFDTLKEAQKKGHKECMFRIANRLIVGYTNDGLVDADTDSMDSDEVPEKQGNFMIMYQNLLRSYIDPNVRTKASVEGDDKNEEYIENKSPFSLAVEWNATNIEPDFVVPCEMIASKALENCKKLRISLRESAMIIPLFAMTYDAMYYYTIQYREDNQLVNFSYNMLHKFNVECKIPEDENGELAVTGAEVFITPDPNSKQTMKSDAANSQD